MYPSKAFFVFLLLFVGQALNAQILRVGRIIETKDTLQKKLFTTFDFGLNLNQEENLVAEIKSGIDITYIHHKNNALILLADFDMRFNGKNKFIDAGYAHVRYQLTVDKNWVPEFFTQYQWNGIRGMENRILAGSNIRICLKRNEKSAFFVALGLMHEREQWNYKAVIPEKIPFITNDKLTNHLKLNSYLKLSHRFSETLYLDILGYIQTRPDKYVFLPRIAPSASLNFKISKKLSYTLKFDAIYDYKPVVPIRNFYYTLDNKLSLSI